MGNTTSESIQLTKEDLKPPKVKRKRKKKSKVYFGTPVQESIKCIQCLIIDLGCY